MKQFLKRVTLYVSLVLFIFSESISQNPTGYFTMVQIPYSQNGVIAATITSGMTPPLTFIYYNHTYVVHPNVNSMSDTLFGTYWINFVEIKDQQGNRFFVYPPVPPPFIIDPPVTTPAVCPAPGSAIITVNGGILPDSVDWYTWDDQSMSLVYQTTGNPANLAAEYYTPFVHFNGYTLAEDTGVWIENISGIEYDVLTTPATCTNGTATITNITGGIPPYTYQWYNGQTSSSITGLTTGEYHVTVTDSQGCYTKEWVSVYQSPYIQVHSTVTNASCLNNDGSVVVFGSGGTPPYSFLFSNGASGSTVCCLTGGTYLDITATDANGCLGSGGAYIGKSTPITVTYTSTSSSCLIPGGSATLTVAGGTPPYTVDWSTFPVQTGLTATNLFPGVYQFNITDAVGCVRSGSVSVSSHSILNAEVNANHAVCPFNNGSISLNISGNNPPYSCTWNNGMTGSYLQNLPVGNYNCTITDNAGCTLLKNAEIQPSNLIGIGITTFPAVCKFESNGSITASAWGGQAPYTFQWSNGQSGNSLNGLQSGNYGVLVTDANGCTKYKTTYLGYDASNDSCYCILKGTVYHDINMDCIKDPGESGIPHIQIHCSGHGYTYTNAAGEYSFMVPTGTYTLSETIQNNYPLSICQNNQILVNVIAASGCFISNDFANNINPLHDLNITTTNITCAVPGNVFKQGLIISNNGTLTETNIQVSYKHDGQLILNTSTPNFFTQPNPVSQPFLYTVNNGFPSMPPGSNLLIKNEFQVPTNIPLTTLIDFYDTVVYAPPMNNWLNDYTPWDNLNFQQAEIIGSFDPNSKEVVPRGDGPEGYIGKNDSILHYIIHFQNTGTYYAEKVVLTDTLDNNLNISTLKPGYSTHLCDYFINEDRVLTITFNNIHLFPQFMSEEGSQGFATFSIHLNSEIEYNSVIQNSADIYFDYNAPVRTNTTVNTLIDNLSITETTILNSLDIFPNPASTKLNIDLKRVSDVEVIRILDLSGRQLFVLPVERRSEITLDISGLPAGFYILQADNKNGLIHTGRFVKTNN